MDLANLDNNDGSDNVLVDSFSVGAPVPVAAGGTFAIPLSAFAYDPANGNLLLDIFTSGLSNAALGGWTPGAGSQGLRSAAQ